MYKLDSDDYLELWKYFQGRADNVKEAMFNSVTWSIGFAAAILGFIATTQLNHKELGIIAPNAVISGSIIGLVVCWYSYILVNESREHIQRNWDRADDCRRKIDGMDDLLKIEKPEKEKPGKYSLQYVWNQVLCVIIFFAILFAALFVWALTDSSE